MNCGATIRSVKRTDDSRALTSERVVIRGQGISSKFFLAPINTGYAVRGIPSKQFEDFYVARSGKGIGITFVGNTAIGKEYVTNAGTPWLSGPHQKWTNLAARIRAAGSLPGMQVGARCSAHAPLKDWKAASIQDVVNGAQKEMNSLSGQSIDSIRDGFIRSAVVASASGFAVVQLHAAHGYFLARMFDSRINRRRDRYNADKLVLLAAIVEGIRSRVPDILLDLRLSIAEGIEDHDAEVARKVALIERLVVLDVDMISLSNGFYDIDKSLIYPDKTQPHGLHIPFAVAMARKYPKKTWNVAGNIYDLAQIPRTIPANLTFSIGRSLIADTEFVAKSAAGRRTSINACVREDCCHYYSKGRRMLACKVNPCLPSDRVFRG